MNRADIIINTLARYPKREWNYAVPEPWAIIFYRDCIPFRIYHTPFAGLRVSEDYTEGLWFWDRWRIKMALRRWIKHQEIELD